MDTREARRKAEARRRVIATQKIERKEKREFGFFAFTVVFLFVAIILVSLYILCFVREIEIENNQYSSTTEIMEWMETDPVIVNSVATFVKYNYTNCELPGQVENIEIKFVTPWSIRVVVEDKIPIGGFQLGSKYIYCDEDGRVVLISSIQLDGIALIEGIEVSQYTLYEILELDDTDIFENVLEVSTILEDNELEVDTISSGTGANVILTIGSIDVLLGEDDYQEKIAQIEALLGNLEGEEGTLDLSSFSTTNTTISFERNNSENSGN